MSSRLSDFTVGMVRLLSQQVSNLDPFFKEIALCDKSEREMIALIKSYEYLTGDMSLNQFIKFFQLTGRAKRDRGELTDLGYFVGMSQRKQAKITKEETQALYDQLKKFDISKGRIKE